MKRGNGILEASEGRLQLIIMGNCEGGFHSFRTPQNEAVVKIIFYAIL